MPPHPGDKMSDYRIIGAEVSPYSVKTRSYFRYKGIPHEWILRGAAEQEVPERRGHRAPTATSARACAPSPSRTAT